MESIWQLPNAAWLWLQPFLPFSVLTLMFILGLGALYKFFNKQAQEKSGYQFRNQLIFAGAVILALIVLLIAIPVNDDLRGQLFSLLGILVSAVIALSSATIVGNVMAGLFLRSIRSFSIGDFLKVSEHFGRVSDIGLLHVEIQTEDKDLKTLPNLFLINQPFTVIHSTGTVISSEVSLGYDVNRKLLEKLLLEAAQEAGLNDPFVQIMALGDFSISYRVGGILTEVRHILSSRSKLRSAIVDILHSNNIEIASPNLMNQRQFPKETKFIPAPSRGIESNVDAGATDAPSSIEKLVFDKAERATKVNRLRKRLEYNEKLLIELEDEVSHAKEGYLKEKAQRKILLFQHQNERLTKWLKQSEKPAEDSEKCESS